MRRKKPRPQNDGEGCQYIYEDGSRCDNPLPPWAWRYCHIHRDSGPKQNKKLTNREYVEDFRRDKRTQYLIQNSNDHSRSRNGLSEPKLRPLLDHAESLQEEYSCKDDRYEYMWDELRVIQRLILHPPADLPSAAKVARKKAKHLLTSLEWQQRDSGHDSDITQLTLATWEIQRDIGIWNSGKALTIISGKAKKVQKLMHDHNELYGFIHALLVRVEIFRIKYFSTDQGQYLVEAHTWLKHAEDVCDQALSRLTGERQQMAIYLRLYIELIKVRLAFDAGEEGQVEQAATHLKAADQMVTAVADAYVTGDVVSTARFITSVSHAEYDLRRGKIDCGCERLKEGKQILPSMKWHSIESTHRVAYIKTALALENNDPESQESLETYMSVFGRYPCYEYLDGLRQLKRAYPDQLAHVNLPEDRRMFLDTTFTHILPHLRYV